MVSSKTGNEGSERVGLFGMELGKNEKVRRKARNSRKTLKCFTPFSIRLIRLIVLNFCGPETDTNNRI